MTKEGPEMSEVLNFQWPSRDEGGDDNEEVVPDGWGDPTAAAADTDVDPIIAAALAEAPAGDAPPPSDEMLVLYIDRAIARRRIEQLSRAYMGALDVIEAQRRRLLALERKAGHAASAPSPRHRPSRPPRPPRPKRPPRTSWLDRLFGVSTPPRDARVQAGKR